MKNDTLTTEILQALLAAPDDSKQRALHALRGCSTAATDDRPILLTISQAATLWGTHRSTVWRAIRAGHLKKVQLFPGCERLRRADVVALAGGDL